MYNCPKCSYGTNAPMEFRNHLKEKHLDIENPDLAYLHAGISSTTSHSFLCYVFLLYVLYKSCLLFYNSTALQAECSKYQL